VTDHGISFSYLPRCAQPGPWRASRRSKTYVINDLSLSRCISPSAPMPPAVGRWAVDRHRRAAPWAHRSVARSHYPASGDRGGQAGALSCRCGIVCGLASILMPCNVSLADAPFAVNLTGGNFRAGAAVTPFCSITGSTAKSTPSERPTRARAPAWWSHRAVPSRASPPTAHLCTQRAYSSTPRPSARPPCRTRITQPLQHTTRLPSVRTLQRGSRPRRWSAVHGGRMQGGRARRHGVRGRLPSRQRRTQRDSHVHNTGVWAIRLHLSRHQEKPAHMSAHHLR